MHAVAITLYAWSVNSVYHMPSGLFSVPSPVRAHTMPTTNGAVGAVNHVVAVDCLWAMAFCVTCALSPSAAAMHVSTRAVDVGVPLTV